MSENHAGDTMSNPAFQDAYPDEFAHCYGCGRLNLSGLRLKTRWAEDAPEETETRFTPRPEHTAMPGFVYGGLVASLIDCHGTGSAAGAALRAQGREVGSGPAPRFVTASLKVDYLKPTPHGVELVARGRIREIKGRKVIVDAELSALGVVVARGEVIAVRIPDSMSGTQAAGVPA
jgi:acyl-coenzyme A thioesterase PaaI-like protein